MIRDGLILLVKAYRLLFRHWIGSACRFEPSCSSYSLQALERHGALAGSYLTLTRLGRCHPWCQGGQDPVPAKPFKGSGVPHRDPVNPSRASTRQHL